ncbi:MAG: hypothetical protein D6B26_02345 [Spirochaetaceae bacterium]|nr:MAG: hypothetical protein D6B26_02345 [Spirochaetaceae bacterium]
MKTKLPPNLILLMAILTTIMACQATEDVYLFMSEGLHPPLISSIKMTSPQRIEVHSDSPLLSAGLQLEPHIAITDSGTEGKLAWFELTEPVAIGERYAAMTVLSNDRGHSAQSLNWIYGFNPNPAGLFLNEIIVAGSGNNPDCLEILVTESGNAGGAAWFLGTAAVHEAAYFFPAIEVNAGDYILLHVQAEGLPEEVDELDGDLAASGGKLSHTAARDLWLSEPVGLPGTNAVLSLYEQADGPISDCIIYSNRTNDSDTTYRGFGTSRMLAWIEAVESENVWETAGSLLRPEDCVNPDGSTGTRSINRAWPYQDTDSKNDWHIVPTLGASFGEDNSNEVYAP